MIEIFFPADWSTNDGLDWVNDRGWVILDIIATMPRFGHGGFSFECVRLDRAFGINASDGLSFNCTV